MVYTSKYQCLGGKVHTHNNMTPANLANDGISLLFQCDISSYTYDSFQDKQRCAHMNNAKDQTITRVYLYMQT